MVLSLSHSLSHNVELLIFLLKSSLLAFFAIMGASLFGLVMVPFRNLLKLEFSFSENLAWGFLLIVALMWYGSGVFDLRAAIEILLGILGVSLITSLFVSRILRIWCRDYCRANKAVVFYGLGIAVFVMFAIGYVIASPYVRTSLPVPSRGNLDVFNYLNLSGQLLNPSQVSYLKLFEREGMAVQVDSFGSVALLAFVGALTTAPLYTVVAPTLLLLAFLFGLTIFQFAKKVIGGSTSLSWLVALQFLMMPLFQYILLNIFFSQMLSSLALLLAIQIVLAGSRGQTVGQLAFRLGPLFGIMLLTYWATFFVNIVLTFSLMILIFFIQKSRPFSEYLYKILIPLGLLLTAGLGVCFPERTFSLFRMLLFISNVKAGWSLQYISPLSLIGLNTGKNVSFAANLFEIFGSIVIFAGVLLWLLRRLVHRYSWSHPKTSLLVTFSGSWLVYNIAYWHFGAASYNQWKFATFYPMLFSFIIAFLFLEWLLFAMKGRVAQSCFFIALGLMAIVTIQYQADSMTFKIDPIIQDISVIDDFLEVQTIIVGSLPTSESMLVPQFIRTKRIRFANYTFYPQLKSRADLADGERAALLTLADGKFDTSDVLMRFANKYVLLKNPFKYLGWEK